MQQQEKQKEEIEQVNRYKYFGIIETEGMRFSKEIVIYIAIAKKTFNRMRQTLFKC